MRLALHLHITFSNGLTAFLLALFFAAVQTVAAQKPAKLRSLANEAAEKGDWAGAYSYLQAAYAIDSASFEVRDALALAAFEIGDFETAVKLFQVNYDKDKGQLRPDALFYLAAAQKRLGQYENAQRNYKTYLKKYKAKGQKYLLERAEHEMKSAQWALQFASNDTTYKTPTRWDEIRTTQSEYLAARKGDNAFFNRTDSLGHWRIWSFSQEETKEIEVGSLDANSDWANMTFLDSAQVLFAVRANDITRIYSGKWNGIRITDANPVAGLNTEGSQNTMPFVGRYNGEQCVYFVSNRANGEGGLDIWYSIAKEGRWQKPLNAGAAVNSPGDELLPTYFFDQLFFASDYRFGFGGMDVFVSPLINGIWQQAINLGDKVNSHHHEVAFHLDKENKTFWLASSRSEELCLDNLTFGCLDVFQGPWDVKEEINTDENRSFFESLAALNEALPVTLYFHNDEPNPKTLDTLSTINYVQSYESYMALIPKYVDENTKSVSSDVKEERAEMIQDFFELQVKKGKQDLDAFCALLLEELQSGHSVRIWIRGFASPRAKSEYNLNLTKRRTSSLINQIATMQNGVFMPYIDDKATSGARLEFIQLPFGEMKAKQGVSDDLLDEEGSIYSRSASLERKIEIESATIMPNTVKEPKLGKYEEVHDFGLISKYQPVKHVFYLPNEGNAPMVVDSVIAECGCTTPEMDIKNILPGEKGQLDVTFDPFGKRGHATKIVTVYIRGMEPKRITLEAEIEK